ncbi:MAG: rhomboid family intramembrane serine protease [Myxococcota bacterium]
MGSTASLASDEEGPSIGTQLKSIAIILGVILGIMWALELVDVLLGQPLNSFGLLPRRISGLTGILTMPFLHGGIAHLAGNSVWLIVFGTMIMLRSKREFLLVFASSTLLGGLGVWLFGNLFTANAVHVGASGVIFGCFGYLLSMGLFERKIGSIVVSVFVLVVYGGFLYGVLPGQAGVSWEGHLFGFLAGVATARFVARRARAASEASARPQGV